MHWPFQGAFGALGLALKGRKTRPPKGTRKSGLISTAKGADLGSRIQSRQATVGIRRPHSADTDRRIKGADLLFSDLFFKTTSLHLDHIYMCLVCLGSFVRAKITHLRAF